MPIQHNEPPSSCFLSIKKINNYNQEWGTSTSFFNANSMNDDIDIRLTFVKYSYLGSKLDRKLAANLTACTCFCGRGHRADRILCFINLSNPCNYKQSRGFLSPRLMQHSNYVTDTKNIFTVVCLLNKATSIIVSTSGRKEVGITTSTTTT